MFWRVACFEVGDSPNKFSVAFVELANVSAACIVEHPNHEISQYLRLEWMLREEVGEVCARRRPVADGIYIQDRQVITPAEVSCSYQVFAPVRGDRRRLRRR